MSALISHALPNHSDNAISFDQAADSSQEWQIGRCGVLVPRKLLAESRLKKLLFRTYANLGSNDKKTTAATSSGHHVFANPVASNMPSIDA
jgi:hypothetical protein